MAPRGRDGARSVGGPVVRGTGAWLFALGRRSPCPARPTPTLPIVTDRDADDLDVRLEWPGDPAPPRRRRPLRADGTGPAPDDGTADDGRIRVRVGESRQLAALARQVEALQAELTSLRSEVAELRTRIDGR